MIAMNVRTKSPSFRYSYSLFWVKAKSWVMVRCVYELFVEQKLSPCVTFNGVNGCHQDKNIAFFGRKCRLALKWIWCPN